MFFVMNLAAWQLHQWQVNYIEFPPMINNSVILQFVMNFQKTYTYPLKLLNFAGKINLFLNRLFQRNFQAKLKYLKKVDLNH